MNGQATHEPKTLHGQILCACGAQVERLVSRRGDGSMVAALLCRHSARVIDEVKLRPASSTLQWTRDESGSWMSKCGRFSVQRSGSALSHDAKWRAAHVGTFRQQTFGRLRDAKAWCGAFELDEDQPEGADVVPEPTRSTQQGAMSHA